MSCRVLTLQHFYDVRGVSLFVPKLLTHLSLLWSYLIGMQNLLNIMCLTLIHLKITGMSLMSVLVKCTMYYVKKSHQSNSISLQPSK